MKTAMLVFFMTLFAGIAFSQSTPNFNEPMREKASDSKVRFYSNSYLKENPVKGEILMYDRVRGENRNKYFKSYNLGIINQSLLLNNFRLRTTRAGKGKC
jgi:hypothetical protein